MEALETDQLLMMKKAWSALYKLPMNDERLLSLTVRELMEELSLDSAWRTYQEKLKQGTQQQRQVNTGSEARNIADNPLVTGDPVFDAQERALFEEMTNG